MVDSLCRGTMVVEEKDEEDGRVRSKVWDCSDCSPSVRFWKQQQTLRSVDRMGLICHLIRSGPCIGDCHTVTCNQQTYELGNAIDSCLPAAYI